MEAPVTLQSTPLAWWLADAVDRRLTGTLVLEETTGAVHRVVLETGAPRKVQTGIPVALLGEVLVDTGTLSEAEREQTLARARQAGTLYGDFLCSEGGVDTTTLGRALREQLARQIAWLIGRPTSTVLTFHEGVNELVAFGAPEGVRVNPRALIWRAIRDGVRPEDVAELERTLGKRSLRLRDDAPIDDFHLEGPYLAVVDTLRGQAASAAELATLRLDEPDAAGRVLYLLVITHAVEIGAPENTEPARLPSGLPPTSGSGSYARPSAIPPSSAAVAELRAEMHDRIEHPRQTHYEVLGVATGASRAEVRSAFTLLAQRFHPDGLVRALPDFAAVAGRLFAEMLEARRVLTDPLERGRYDRSLRLPTSPPPSARPSLAPSPAAERSTQSILTRVESLLAHGNLAGAEHELALALERDRDNAEVVALWTFTQIGKPDVDLRRLWARLERAATVTDTARVHYYRGQLLKRMGKPASALAEFRMVLDLEPRHIDAAREVRLAELGRDVRTSHPPRPRSGTFQADGVGSLFGWLKRKQ